MVIGRHVIRLTEHAIGLAVIYNIYEKVEIHTANGLLHDTLSFAGAEAGEIHVHDIGGTLIACKGKTVLVLALAFCAPLRQKIINFLSHILTAGYGNQAQRTYRNRFQISLVMLFNLLHFTLSAAESMRSSLHFSHFSGDTNVRSRQLQNGVAACDSGKNTIGITVSKLRKREIGGNDGSPSAKVPLIQEGEQLCRNKIIGHLCAEIINDKNLTAIQIIQKAVIFCLIILSEYAGRDGIK